MRKLKINLDFSLKRLDLVTKGLVSTKFLGGYRSVFKGQGLEFSNYRDYMQGSDDASTIDWNTSRRVNNLMVKEFVEERNLSVIFVVDVSAKMLTSSTKQLKAEYIAEMISSLTYSMLKAGDAVGLTLFSDKIVKFLPPQSGLKQFYSLTTNLANTKYYGGPSIVEDAMDFVFKRVETGALVILISDFIYPLRSEKSIKLAARKFDLISLMVRDVRDMNLPAGIGEIVLQDPYSEGVLLVNPEKIRKEYAKDANASLSKIKKTMKKIGSDFLLIQTNKPFTEYLVKFFKERETKWR
jgi:uncharacterized protein (DUF58 family)